MTNSIEELQKELEETKERLFKVEELYYNHTEDFLCILEEIEYGVGDVLEYISDTKQIMIEKMRSRDG